MLPAKKTRSGLGKSVSLVHPEVGRAWVLSRPSHGTLPPFLNNNHHFGSDRFYFSTNHHQPSSRTPSSLVIISLLQDNNLLVNRSRLKVIVFQHFLSHFQMNLMFFNTISINTWLGFTKYNRNSMSYYRRVRKSWLSYPIWKRAHNPILQIPLPVTYLEIIMVNHFIVVIIIFMTWVCKCETFYYITGCYIIYILERDVGDGTWWNIFKIT
jgi:hypothetical protein